MDEFIRTCTLRDEKSDEHDQMHKQEDFIDGSYEFLPKLLFQKVESTLNRWSKWIVSTFFGVFILWKHDAEAVWFAAGSILNGMFSILLKKILNQKRPSNLEHEPGMPSSHAQSIFFIVMLTILSSAKLFGINEITISSSGLLLVIGSYLSYLRVSQKLHTVNQVIVGAFIGSIYSILWYWLWHAFMLHAYLSSFWVRILLILGYARISIGFLLYMIYHQLKVIRKVEK